MQLKGGGTSVVVPPYLHFSRIVYRRTPPPCRDPPFYASVLLLLLVLLGKVGGHASLRSVFGRRQKEAKNKSYIWQKKKLLLRSLWSVLFHHKRVVSFFFIFDEKT